MRAYMLHTSFACARDDVSPARRQAAAAAAAPVVLDFNMLFSDALRFRACVSCVFLLLVERARCFFFVRCAFLPHRAERFREPRELIDDEIIMCVCVCGMVNGYD